MRHWPTVYLHELVSYLSESYATDKRIQFKLNLQPLEPDIPLAVPLGLIPPVNLLQAGQLN
jgi:hypothetical protein